MRLERERDGGCVQGRKKAKVGLMGEGGYWVRAFGLERHFGRAGGKRESVCARERVGTLCGLGTEGVFGRALGLTADRKKLPSLLAAHPNLPLSAVLKTARAPPLRAQFRAAEYIHYVPARRRPLVAANPAPKTESVRRNGRVNFAARKRNTPFLSPPPHVPSALAPPAAMPHIPRVPVRIARTITPAR